MCICKICKKEFKNNLGGNLTLHLLQDHNMLMEDYVIKFELDGNIPKCMCGYCIERPVFYRGKFRRYAKNHNTFEWKKQKYIEKNGIPKCKNCNKDVMFYRGEPSDICSNTCKKIINPSINKLKGGFSNPLIQEKIKQSVIKKYGIDNVSKLLEVRKKISLSKMGKTWKMNDDSKNRISKSLKEKWKDNNYKNRVSKSIKKSLNTIEQRTKRSENQLKRLENNEYKKLIIDNLCKVSKKFSKLHQKIRNELKLETIGFISEKKVDKYLVDELNEEKKIIIEINGDYVHANPKIYNSTDIIYLPGNSYTSSEKWESDKIKKENLEKMGYKVIIIWESDDLNFHKIKINEYVR